MHTILFPSFDVLGEEKAVNLFGPVYAICVPNKYLDSKRGPTAGPKLKPGECYYYLYHYYDYFFLK